MSVPLTILQKPSEFVPVVAREGASIYLECQLSGLKGEHSVKWLKDGSEVAYESAANISSKNAHYVDEGDNSLTMAQVTLADDGVYDCAMYNERQEFVIKAKRRYKLRVHGL